MSSSRPSAQSALPQLHPACIASETADRDSHPHQVTASERQTCSAAAHPPPPLEMAPAAARAIATVVAEVCDLDSSSTSLPGLLDQIDCVYTWLECAMADSPDAETVTAVDRWVRAACISSFACILVGLTMHCEALTPSIGAQLAAFAKLQARHFAFLQGNRSRRPTGGAARCPPRCRRPQRQCCDGGGRRTAVCSGLHTFLLPGKYCFQVSIGQGNTSALWLRHAATNMRARPDGQAGSQWHREHKRHGWYSVYPDTPPG